MEGVEMGLEMIILGIALGGKCSSIYQVRACICSVTLCSINMRIFLSYGNGNNLKMGIEEGEVWVGNVVMPEGKLTLPPAGDVIYGLIDLSLGTFIS